MAGMMKEAIETPLIGSAISSIEVRTEEDCKGEMRGAVMGYEIVIRTTTGEIVIEGCHDQSPDVQEGR